MAFRRSLNPPETIRLSSAVRKFSMEQPPSGRDAFPRRPSNWRVGRSKQEVGRLGKASLPGRSAGETLRDLFAFREQRLGHVWLERFEELLLAFELRFPLVRFHGEQFFPLFL